MIETFYEGGLIHILTQSLVVAPKYRRASIPFNSSDRISPREKRRHGGVEVDDDDELSASPITECMIVDSIEICTEFFLEEMHRIQRE